MKKYYFYGVLMFAGFLLFASDAYALSLQPTLIDDISLRPGESVAKAVKLTNDGGEKVTLKAAFYDADAGFGTSGTAQYSARTADSTLSNWIILESDEVTLAAGQTTLVRLYIKTPQDASPGGHYAMLAWGAPVGSTLGSAATIAGQLGTNIAVDIKGDVYESADITSFVTADGLTKYEKLPITFAAKLTNNGNRHFKPSGDVKVRNMFGSLVATLPFNTENAGFNVLPRSSREFKVTWDSGFAFGKYTATLEVLMGGAGSAQKSFEFWVLPTGLLVLWLIIALVLVVILALLVKKMLEPATRK